MMQVRLLLYVISKMELVSEFHREVRRIPNESSFLVKEFANRSETLGSSTLGIMMPIAVSSLNAFRRGSKMAPLLLVISLAVISNAWANPPESSGKEKAASQVSVENVIRLEDKDAGTLTRKKLNLGLFRPGTKVNLSLEVKNDSMKSYGFDHVDSGCKCLSVSPSSARLDPGERVIFNVVLQAPQTITREYQEASFWVSRGLFRQFAVHLKYSGRGVVGFKDSAVRIDLPNGSEDKTVSIPFFADALSPPELVDVEVEERISALEPTLDYKKKLILLRVPTNALDNDRLTGQMVIRNIETDSHDVITIDVSEERPSKIFPSAVRFARSKRTTLEQADEEGLSRFVANVVIHCKNVPKDTKIHAEFSVGGHPLAVVLRRVRNGVAFYRIVLKSELAIEAAMKKEAWLDCTVIAGKVKDGHRLPIVFNSNWELRE